MSTPISAKISQVVFNGPARSEVGRKQLTLAFGGLYIASTTTTAKPLLVWEEEKGYARYYIPQESLHNDIQRGLIGTDTIKEGSGHDINVTRVDSVVDEDGKSHAVIERLTVGQKSTTWIRFTEGSLKGFIRFERSEIDDWFEDGALFSGIKNPYKRIDTAAVSHHIVVKVDGEEVAETNVAVRLNETGLKETYYIPATSIKNWGSVEKSDLRTACPYKGEAWYLSLVVRGKKFENLIWYYQYPTHESAAVQGLISFSNKDGVDIFLDGAKI